ncbi:DUF2946 family protein [Fontivita pretiosa]|jgi:hypothetical protein|uniref:DUF2946 family protein n=1 Tax=Fontivita pretiosa TaxID=2989684 RepID=UPI003D1788BD
MRPRIGHIALILFQTLWLNVILPGHTRGIVTLPGGSDDPASGRVACSGCCGGGGSDSSPTDKPTPRDRARCAICFFAARLTAPPVVDLRPPPLELTALVPIPRPVAFESLQLIPAYDSRAPPALG